MHGKEVRYVKRNNPIPLLSSCLFTRDKLSGPGISQERQWSTKDFWSEHRWIWRWVSRNGVPNESGGAAAAGHYVALLLRCYVVMPPCDYATVSLHYCVAVPLSLCHCVTTCFRLYHHVAMLLCHYVVASLCHYVQCQMYTNVVLWTAEF